MVDSKIRVFVFETTSADPLCVDAALGSQGRSMRNAMVADLARLDDVSVTCAVADASEGTLAPGVRPSCRPPWRSARDYLREEAASHHRVWVVAPESGGVLAALRDVVEDRQWLGCSKAAIVTAGSKRATSACLRRFGIAMPTPIDDETTEASSRMPQDRLGADGIGWVVKPDDGCGTSHVRRHRHLAAALADRAARRQRGEQAVVERWVAGEPLSMTLLCSPREVEVLALNRQRILSDESGLVRFEGVEIGPVPADRRTALAALAQRIRQALPGLGGIVGVDLAWHPVAGPVVIEINPRPTCAYGGLSRLLRRNLAAEVLAQHRRAWPADATTTFGAQG